MIKLYNVAEPWIFRGYAGINSRFRAGERKHEKNV